MSGTLYVVATPIGNLEDITLRALRILREVNVIAAEDTRRTAHLLAAHGLGTKTLSFHEHNTKARIPQLLARLHRGEHVAVVSDAGTPGVSDPGLELVQACLEQGIRVDPVPGPSAPIAAAMASGLPMTPFTIFGFPPHRSNDRKRWWMVALQVAHTFSFFESPHRIAKTLNEATDLLVNRPIIVARELTKIHQEFVDIRLNNRFSESASRGEFTVLVGPSSQPTASLLRSNPTDDEIVHEFRCFQAVFPSRREAIRATGAKLGISQKLAYAAVERFFRDVGQTTD